MAITIKHNKITLALLAGVVSSLAFPLAFGDLRFPNLGFLAWFSFIPLLFAVRGENGRKSFLLSFLTFFVLYAVSLSWLYVALNTFGGLPPVLSVLVLFLLIVMQATFNALTFLFSAYAEKKLSISRYATIPVFWTAIEFFRNYFPCNGFPWGNITNSQYDYLYLIQCVDIFGIYGLTFIMATVNCTLALCLLKEKGYRRSIYLSVAFVAFIFVYGIYRVSDVDVIAAGAPSIRAAMIQGNISQEDKWKNGGEVSQLQPFRKYTSLLMKSGVDLIVWPEAAYPFPIPYDTVNIQQESLMSEEPPETAKANILLGALSERTDGKKRELFNSVFLTDKKGDVLGEYSKVHLVPFGEYVPYKKFLFFVKKLTAPIGNMVPGPGIEPIYTGAFSIGPLICYEDVFPEISRAHTQRGANLLVTVTNDAWYGRSSAAFQHLAISIFRSVGNKRYMVKSANTGISAVIDPIGRVLSKTGIYEQGVIVSNVKLLNFETFYTRFGDWFAYTMSVLAGLLVVLAVFNKKNKKKR